MFLDLDPSHGAEKNMNCWNEELERIKHDGLDLDYKEKCDCK